jgi:hypothetical protein
MLAERYLTLHRAELVAEVIEIVRGDAEFMLLAVAETKRRGRYWPAKPKKPEPLPKFVYPLDLMHKDWPSFEEAYLDK